MNKKKLIPVAAAAVLTGTIGIGSTFAYFSDSEQVSNVITTGNIDISLWETDAGQNKNFEGMTFEGILPGDHLAKNPTITMEDGSAYLRVKVTMSGETEADTQNELAESVWESVEAGLAENGWIKGAGDYYYYQEAAVQGSDYVVFDGIDVDAGAVDGAKAKFNIDIVAEAVQDRNFTPYKDTEGTIYAWYQTEAEQATTVVK